MVVTAGVGPAGGLLDAYGAAPHGIQPPAGRPATRSYSRTLTSRWSGGSSAEQTGTARRSAVGAPSLDDGAAAGRPT